MKSKPSKSKINPFCHELIPRGMEKKWDGKIYFSFYIDREIIASSVGLKWFKHERHYLASLLKDLGPCAHFTIRFKDSSSMLSTLSVGIQSKQRLYLYRKKYWVIDRNTSSMEKMNLSFAQQTTGENHPWKGNSINSKNSFLKKHYF